MEDFVNKEDNTNKKLPDQPGITGNDSAGDPMPVSDDDKKGSEIDKKDNSTSDDGNAKTDNKNKEDKEMSEINLDQTNISENADSQQNKMSMLFKSVRDAAFNINIGNGNVATESKFNFHEFHYMNYRRQLTELEAAYIDFYVPDLFKKLDDARIIVINNNVSNDAITMAIVEALVFRESNNSIIKSISCQPGDGVATLELVFGQFLKYKAKKKNFGEAKKHFIVIYGNKDKNIKATDFLSSFLYKGGIADAIANSLRSAKLFIIYVANDTGLYKKAIQDRAHFAVLNISELHSCLFKLIPDPGNFNKIRSLMEIALSEYDWCINLNSEERKQEMINLIQKGTLESALNNMIISVDRDELKVITDLIRDPLNGMVMFATTFFEDIGLKELDSLVRALISEYDKVNASKSSKETQTYVSIWEINADEILSNCGISLVQLHNGLSGYRFVSQARKKNTRRILCEKYSLTLVRRFEIIEKNFLLSNEPLSESFLAGITELAFTNARSDENRHLKGTCLNITKQIQDSEGSEQDMRNTFNKLRYLISRWSDHTEYGQTIHQFYHSMIIDPFHRGLMGAILTHICDPLKPHYLKHLKTLLDATGEEEQFVKFNVVRIIANNYENRALDLISEIERWSEQGDLEKISQSYSFAKCSLLLLFYEKRFYWDNVSGLDYRLIKMFEAGDIDQDAFNFFLSFVFSLKTEKAFNHVFGKTISSQLYNQHWLERAQKDSLFSMYAFIMVQWYYLLSLDKHTGEFDDKRTDDMMTHSLAVIRDTFGSGPFETALQKVIKKYNVLVIQIKELKDAKPEKKEVYKMKRDIARHLVELSNQFTV